MAKNISLLGADYPNVPAVQLPQTGGGTATFYDINVIDNLNSTSATDALSANQGRELNEKKVDLDLLNRVVKRGKVTDGNPQTVMNMMSGTYEHDVGIFHLGWRDVGTGYNITGNCIIVAVNFGAGVMVMFAFGDHIYSANQSSSTWTTIA